MLALPGTCYEHGEILYAIGFKATRIAAPICFLIATIIVSISRNLASELALSDHEFYFTTTILCG